MKRIWALCCATLVIASAGSLEAQAPAELERAKQLFRQGNELRKAGDCQRALEFFVQSRKLVPSVPNVLNAAYCLNVLGRFDEALEHYELLLTDFKAELRPEELELIEPAMKRLREQVGSLDVRSNVADATLIVDGRPRGQLPLVGPIRVLPGEHEIVVSREGYQSFQARVSVSAAKLQIVRAELALLKLAGRLRVDQPRGAELIVDGAPVGKLPWEGTLAPGEHWFAVQHGEQGSAPARVIVVDGQTVLGIPTLGRLGPEIQITIEPASAQITISGVAVGRGGWRGRLPHGAHGVQARAEGYLALEQRLDVTATGPRTLPMKLTIDESHPRWGVKRGSFFVDALLGPAISPGLGSGAEASCDQSIACTSSPIAFGFFAAARGGYELPTRMSLEILAGYLQLGKSQSRRLRAEGSVPAVFDLDDELRVAGPLLGAGVGYRLQVTEQFSLRGALVAGAILIGAKDEIDASATAAGQTASATVAGSGGTTRSANLFVMPELAARVSFSGFRLGFGVLVPIVLLQGPDNEHGETSIDQFGQCTANNVFCTSRQDFTVRERAYAPFVTVVPAVSAGFVF